MTLQAKFRYAAALIALLALSLAAFGVHAVRDTSDLIVRLYDKPLMGVNYARAASATLAGARALTSQSRLLGPQSLAAILPSLQQMQSDIAEDLRIVRERVEDAGVVGALNHAEAAIADWSRSERMILWPPPEGLTTVPMPSTADRQGAVAGVGLDDLVELVAADGYTYRRRAEAEMRASNVTFILMAGFIILLSAVVVALFARLLIRPICDATRIAEDVAVGRFATINVFARRDEIGRLMSALATMQANLLSRQQQTQTLLEEKDSAADALRHINLRFNSALNNMSHGLLMCDADLRVVVVNRQFCKIYDIDPAAIGPGHAYGDLLALSIAAGNHPDRTMDDVIAECVPTFHGNESETSIRTIGNGRIIAVSDARMGDGGWVATHEDITERKQTEDRIAFMARHDALTKLPNRAMFRDRMEEAIAMTGRGGQFAVLCLDLDKFKRVNDTMGHPVGDALLAAVAGRVRSCVREGDTVARLGGDEFGIIQLAVRQPDDADSLARRIIAAFGQPFDLGGRQVMSGVSIGVAVAPRDGVVYETLMTNADIALYLAKAEGRGTARFFEPEMDARIHLRRALEKDIESAIVRNEFELYYQPQVSLSGNRVVAFEALLRWHHPVRGFVSPLEFIPVAEETGTIVAIGEWVLRTACFEAENWPANINVAVNLSPVQFRKNGLVPTVQAALNASGLRPDRLELDHRVCIPVQLRRHPCGTASTTRHGDWYGLG